MFLLLGFIHIAFLNSQRAVPEEELESDDEEEIEVYPKPMSERFLLRLEHLETALQVVLSDVGGPKKSCNVCITEYHPRKCQHFRH